MYFTGSDEVSPATEAVEIFADLAPGFLAETVRTAATNGTHSAAQSARRSQDELGAMSIRNAGRVCRLIIV